MASCDRREFLSSVAAGVAASAVSGGAAPVDARAGRDGEGSVARGGLAPLAFTPLPIGAIRPAGWLLRQLRIQADGLTGHLDEFWPDVGESQWFGGKAEGWERAPYWLDGAIPLAWILDDEPLKARITRYVDFIVTHQRADGWYSPYPEDAVTKRYDMWAILLANKVLVQYHEATGDARALDAVVKSLKAILAGLDRTPLYGWGKFRWYEGLVSVYYVYERTREPWLLDLARKLREQGVDFEALYKTGGHPAPDAAPRPLEMDQARGQHRDGREGSRAELAPRPAARRQGVRQRDDRAARPRARPGHRHVQRRRVPGRPQPDPGHGALRRRRVHVLAGAPVLGLRRRARSATAWSAWRSTRCRPRSPPTCGRTSTTSR